ncbi:fimbrial protein [Pseudomonas protegens]|uniref:fimbrial protein n=1 Tax=Pseudomonas protegens TaxID=380021 RepID=UPI00396737B1
MRRSTVIWLNSLVLLAAGSAAPLHAQPPLQRGQLQMVGEIFDAACAIQVQSQYQTISMAPAPIRGLVSGQASPQQAFDIQIVNCGSTSRLSRQSLLNSFAVVFEGEGNDRYFATQGTAKGIAIHIKDTNGNPVIPGVPVKGSEVSITNMALNYLLTLVGSGASLSAGDYHATIRLGIHHF